MVNPEMFKDAFTVPKKQEAVQPIPQNNPYIPMDDDTEKLRKWLLWGLTILVGGAAALLLVWRIILKFI